MDSFEVVAKLEGGLSNLSYLLKNHEGHYVKKTYSSHTTFFSDMHTEIICLEHFANKQVSADLIWKDETQRSTIVSYIEGESLTKDSLVDPKNLSEMLRIIKTIHHSPLRLSRVFHPLHRTEETYAELSPILPVLCENQVASAYQNLCADLRKIPFNEEDFVTCHIDLVPENFIRMPSGELRVIDWEYAAHAPCLVDFASLFASTKVSEEIEQRILSRYFSELTDDLWHQFQVIKRALNFYWYMWSQWQSYSKPEWAVYKKMSEMYWDHIFRRRAAHTLLGCPVPYCTGSSLECLVHKEDL